MSGPTGRRRGIGHRIGPAVTPAGSVQPMRVGIPESPGYFQYVCQPGSCAMRRATVSVRPGAAVATSATSSAVA